MSGKRRFDCLLHVKDAFAFSGCENFNIRAMRSQNQVVNSPWKQELYQEREKYNPDRVQCFRQVGSCLLFRARGRYCNNEQPDPPEEPGD